MFLALQTLRGHVLIASKPSGGPQGATVPGVATSCCLKRAHISSSNFPRPKSLTFTAINPQLKLLNPYSTVMEPF